MDERKIPADAVACGVSAEFTGDALPAALRKEHRTRPGVYGRLIVLAGTVRLVLGERAVALAADDEFVLLPDEPHHVEPGDGLRMRIDFFEVPGCS